MRQLYYSLCLSDAALTALIAALYKAYPDWLLLSDDDKLPNCLPLRHGKNLLGSTTQALIFDARHGFALDYFLCAAHTLKKGGALCLILDPSTVVDGDSIRFHSALIASPFFKAHLQQGLRTYGQAYIVGMPLRIDSVAVTSVLERTISAAQQTIITDFCAASVGVYTLFCARGTGKSWLGNALMQQLPMGVLTGPNQNSVRAYEACALKYFYAPDYLIAKYDGASAGATVLIVEEAARIPLAHIEALTHRFAKVLLISSVDNYEGTGRGLVTKLAGLVSITKAYALTEGLRFDLEDKVAQFCDHLGLKQTLSPARGNDDGTRLYEGDQCQELRQDLNAITRIYQLLNQTHYQTNAQDIRRLMDAPEQCLLTDCKAGGLVGTIWGIHEGGQDHTLAREVYRGQRRPKGNLVAQTLSAHSYYPEAMVMRSLRISRIAVVAHLRCQGRAQAMLAAIIAHYQTGKDFISTSFGLTAELLVFWQKCGFHWIHLGSHRDKTTGLHAAIMVYPLSDQAHAWLKIAQEKWLNDAFFLRQAPFLSADAKALLPRESSSNQLNNAATEALLQRLDDEALKAHHFGNKPLTSVYAALKRAQLSN